MFGAWGAIVAAAAASVGYAARQQAEAAEEQRRQFEKTQADMNPWLLTLSSSAGLTDFPVLRPAMKPYTPGPCGGCGSRETVIHRGARMCAYCRSDR